MLAVAAAAVACNKEIIEEPNTPAKEVKYIDVQFSANLEGQPESKTILDNDGRSVNWLKNDIISVFDNSAITENHKNKFTISENFLSFSGSVPEDADVFYALYPNITESKIDLAANTISTILPSVQEATIGSFASNTAIMVAKADENNQLLFKNVCSHIKFTLAEDMDDVKSITLMGNKDEILAGAFTIDYNNGNPTITPTANKAETYVTLRKSDGSALAAGDYFFTILPVEFEEGFTVILSKTDGSQVAKRTSIKYSQIAERNSILTMKALASTDYAKHENYFVKYNDGFNLTFCGITFNKTTNPGGVLVSDRRDKSFNLAASDTGVYFITSSCTKAKFNAASAYKSLIVVGADAAMRSNVDFYRQVRPYDGGELMLLANLRCTIGAKNAFAQNINTDGHAFKTFGNIAFSNCHFKNIGKNFFEFNTVNVFTKLKLTVEDCEFGISGENVYLLNVKSENASSAQSISLKNNIFYAESSSAATKFRLVYGAKMTIDSFNLESSTFDNIISDRNMIIVGDIATSFGMAKNLFFECNKTEDTKSQIVSFKINTSAPNATGVTTNNVYYNSASNATTGAGIGDSAYKSMTINSFKKLVGKPMSETWNPSMETYGEYVFDEGISNTIGAKRTNTSSTTSAD